jgi:LDH2 family malate/lactate/ureidoglycolate dehydrogenase
LFREGEAFEASVAKFCDDMRATPPVDPALPVLVAGDKERAVAKLRSAQGVPVGAGLLAQIRALAEAADAPWLMG